MIKKEIIKFIEGQGKASKSKIEDYMKDLQGTTGDTVSRRLRELVASAVIRKTQKDYNGKKYYEYSVVEEDFWGKSQVEAGIEAGQIKNEQLKQEIVEQVVEEKEVPTCKQCGGRGWTMFREENCFRCNGTGKSYWNHEQDSLNL